MDAEKEEVVKLEETEESRRPRPTPSGWKSRRSRLWSRSR